MVDADLETAGLTPIGEVERLQAQANLRNLLGNYLI
jgi:hypothetical protein